MEARNGVATALGMTCIHSVSTALISGRVGARLRLIEVIRRNLLSGKASSEFQLKPSSSQLGLVSCQHSSASNVVDIKLFSKGAVLMTADE